MSEKLITIYGMQAQAKRIKNVLNKSGEWKLEGNAATFGCKYHNADLPVTVKGVKSVENFALNDNFVTVGSGSYDTDTQVTISGADYEFTLADTINAQVVTPNTKIVCNTGNDTILNTGAAVTVYTGADGSSSISDYAPHSNYNSQIYSRGNADTIYIEEAPVIFCRDSLCNNDKQIISFSDKATVATYAVSVPSATNFPKSPENIFIKRAKNLKNFQFPGKTAQSFSDNTIRIGNQVTGCVFSKQVRSDYVTIDSGAGGNVYSFGRQYGTLVGGTDSIYGWNTDSDTLRIFTSEENTKFYMSKDGKGSFASIKSGGIVELEGVEQTYPNAKTIKVQYGYSTVTTEATVPFIIKSTGKQLLQNVNSADTPAKNGDSATKLSISSGSSGDDTIINEGDNVYAGGALLTVNKGNNVYIDKGASIVSEGNNVTIEGDYSSISPKKIVVQSRGTTAADVTSGVKIINVWDLNADVSKDIYTVQSGGNGDFDTIQHAGHFFSTKYLDNPGHIFYFRITGFSTADTLFIDNHHFNDGVESVISSATPGSNETFRIQVSESKIVVLNGIVKKFSGKSIKVYYQKQGEETLSSFDIPVPKKFYLSTSTPVTLTGGKNGTFDYNNYTIGGSGSADTIIIDGATGISLDTGAGNDCITVTGGSKDCSIYGGARDDSIYIDNASGIYVDAGAGTDCITITGGAQDCSIANLARIGTAKGVYVDGNTITLTGGSKDCTIYAGKKSYVDNASNVYVDASTGANQVWIMSGAGTCTIANGASLRAYSYKPSGNLYIMTATNQTASIFGYKAEDSILIDGASYTHTASADYNYIYYEGNTGKKILLKGALKEGAVVGSSVASDYEQLALGTKLNISVSSGDKYVDSSTRSIWVGTTGADTMNIAVDNAIVSLGKGADSVTVSGSNASITSSGNNSVLLTNTAANATVSLSTGADSVTVSGTNCSLNAGSGNNVILLESTANYCTILGGTGKDSVTVNSSNCFINAGASIDAIYLNSPASNCTIYGSASNDSIFNNSNGNVFYYAGSTAEGTDSLTAFNSNDLFYIADSDCTVTDALVSGNARLQFTKDTTNTYVLLIGKTTGDTVRIKLGAEGAVQTYTIGTGFSQ